MIETRLTKYKNKIKCDSKLYEVAQEMICLFSPDIEKAPQLPINPKTRTYHVQVEAARRTAERRNRAGPGRTGRRRVGSPAKQSA